VSDSPSWNRLDAAGFGVSVKRSVRRLAWIEAAVGIVATACGVAAHFLPLVTLGVALAGIGFWNLARPSEQGVLVDGLGVILAGVFNLVAWMWMDHARPTAVGKWMFAGILQVVWGVRRLALYPTARGSTRDASAVTRLEALVREISRRDAKHDPNLVEFRTGRLHWHRNRLGLFAEGAIGLLEGGAVRLEKRGEIWIEASGTHLLGRTIKVKIQMSDYHLAARMQVEHFERFERWKLGQSQVRSIAA